MLFHRILIKLAPAQEEHHRAVPSERGIGRTFPSHDVSLWGSTGGRRHGMERYPMLVPASQEYGSVNLRLSHRGHHYSVKIYPRLVHVVKSFNSHLQVGIPKTLSGVRNHSQAALRMIHSSTGEEADSLGGWIEVTVKAITLKEATNKVEKTGFLDPAYWLGKGPGPAPLYPLSVRLIPRDQLLANATWVYQQAHNAEIFEALAKRNRHPFKSELSPMSSTISAEKAA